MTMTVSMKITIIGSLLLALLIPAMSFAATPSVADLQTQYQTLMSRFESLKDRHASTSSSTKDRSNKASTTVDRTCMATAVATREASIKTAFTTFTGSITSALDTRSSALASAWNGSADGSRDAVKKAWADWKTSSKAAHTKLRAERKTAWESFKKTARETCKVTTPKEEGLEKETKDSIAL